MRRDDLLTNGGRHLFHGAMLAAATIARFTPNLSAERARMRILRDVPYASRGPRVLTLDVFAPRSPGPHPLFLYVHGGGFRMGSKETHWAMAIPLVRAGFVVMMPSYRLAPEHPYPAALEDAAAALCFAHDHAPRFDADPSRVVVGGESAGGNLTLGLGIACTFARDEPLARPIRERAITPRALAPLCAFAQASDVERFVRAGRVHPFVLSRMRIVSDGYLRGADPAVDRALADPLVLLESTTPSARAFPPTFASCGLADPIVDDTRRLERALRARGVEVAAPLYADQIHGFQAAMFHPVARRHWAELTRFLARHVEGVRGLPDGW